MSDLLKSHNEAGERCSGRESDLTIGFTERLGKLYIVNNGLCHYFSDTWGLKLIVWFHVFSFE